MSHATLYVQEDTDPITIATDWVDSSLKASWSKPVTAAFTGYKVTCRPKDSGDPPPDDLAMKEVIVDDPDVTFTTFDDLQERVTYLVEVVVLDGEKEIDKASTEAAPKKATKLPPVENAKVEPAPGTLKVTWKRPEGEVKGYLITCSPEKEDKKKKKKEDEEGKGDDEDKKDNEGEEKKNGDEKGEGKKKKKDKTTLGDDEKHGKEKKKKEKTSIDGDKKKEKTSVDSGGKKGTKDEKKEIKLDDPAVLEAVFNDLDPNTVYVIKVYSLDGESKSDSVKLTGKPGMYAKQY
eukprot:XP_011660958.1 PREDICTED: uncharacterized protein LOC105436754 [Strongylocentrotus purpuratus]